jgi:hypothetical protein
MEIQTAVYNPELADSLRTFRVYKDGIQIRERASRNLHADFYGFARGLNNRLALECQGYLKAVNLLDTEISQKEAR